MALSREKLTKNYDPMGISWNNYDLEGVMHFSRRCLF